MITNKEKDIILICKGWYNQERYKTTLSALMAYQCEYCGLQYDDKIPFYDILRFAIYPVANKYFKQHHWMELFRDRIYTDISLNQFKSACSNRENEGIHLSYKYLCELFIGQIHSLSVLDDAGGVIIDFSEYPKSYVQIV